MADFTTSQLVRQIHNVFLILIGLFCRYTFINVNKNKNNTNNYNEQNDNNNKTIMNYTQKCLLSFKSLYIYFEWQL